MPSNDPNNDLSFEQWAVELAEKRDPEALNFVNELLMASAPPEHLELVLALLVYKNAPLSGAEAKERDDYVEEILKYLDRVSGKSGFREKMAAELKRAMHDSGE
jgi:hypothetical protein